MLDLTGYRLTFSDEFNTRSISQDGVGTTWADIRSEWRFDANSDIGFGHSSFVDPASGYDPFKVAGGVLSITAVPDRTRFGYSGSWESGLITTQGDFSQTYGYFEMRADLADSVGGWDAFWLMPNQPAPNPNKLSGWQELDVVEHYGSYNQGTYRWIHTTDPEPNLDRNERLQVFSNNPTQISGYHTYGMNWQADLISFYFDGQYMGSRATPSDMHGPMYLLANLATQGSDGSNANIASVPIEMKIDYIRAYSNDPNTAAVPLSSISSPDGLDPGLYGATVATMLPNINKIGWFVVRGTSASDILRGTEAKDLIYTEGGRDSIYAAQGNDVIVANGQIIEVDGGLGIDTVLTGFALQDLSAIGGVDDHKYINRGSEYQHFVSVERFVFTNDMIAMDIQGNAGDVYRLYQAAFDRIPDTQGLSAHINAVDHGVSIHDDALTFISSPEFSLRYGSHVSDQNFVNALYQNVLDRAPDAAGNANWMLALSTNTIDRASALVGFSDSIENHNNVDPTILAGIHLDYSIMA